MKQNRNYLVVLVLLLLLSAGVMFALSFKNSGSRKQTDSIAPKSEMEKIKVEMIGKETIKVATCCTSPATPIRNEEGCVFKTVFGEESADSNFIYKTPQRIKSSIHDGLDWMRAAGTAG